MHDMSLWASIGLGAGRLRTALAIRFNTKVQGPRCYGDAGFPRRELLHCDGAGLVFYVLRCAGRC